MRAVPTGLALFTAMHRSFPQYLSLDAGSPASAQDILVICWACSATAKCTNLRPSMDEKRAPRIRAPSKLLLDSIQSNLDEYFESSPAFQAKRPKPAPKPKYVAPSLPMKSEASQSSPTPPSISILEPTPEPQPKIADSVVSLLPESEEPQQNLTMVERIGELFQLAHGPATDPLPPILSNPTRTSAPSSSRARVRFRDTLYDPVTRDQVLRLQVWPAYFRQLEEASTAYSTALQSSLEPTEWPQGSHLPRSQSQLPGLKPGSHQATSKPLETPDLAVLEALNVPSAEDNGRSASVMSIAETRSPPLARHPGARRLLSEYSSECVTSIDSESSTHEYPTSSSQNDTDGERDSLAAPRKRRTDNCGACTAVVEREQSLVCRGCDRVFHQSCLLPTAATAEESASLPWFCSYCPTMDLSQEINAYRLGSKKSPLSAGGRELRRAVLERYTPAIDASGRISEPFGCRGFVYIREFLSPTDQAQLLNLIGDSPNKYEKHLTNLTTSTVRQSRKIVCCDDLQREYRGGRYAMNVLRTTATYPMINYTLDGTNITLNDCVESLFESKDPFVTETKILCQQITWHLEDLELHCDRERPDKTHERQPNGFDGVGDRITSLTLRKSCWLFMRETANPRTCFAVRLRPGDLWTITGESRWKWQHGIFLEEIPADVTESRISLVWRLIEQWPE
eukprot:m.342201 g.342201  ORF g.342201 m.342201 type:complete len:682 (+) comp55776_c0_seq9:531-2576(+)